LKEAITMVIKPEARVAGGSPSPDDLLASKRFPWLTPRHIIIGVLAWLGAFSIGSVFIENPFASETSAQATPNYWHVMYLHGLLIGMVGLAALLACEVFGLKSRHVRLWIAGGVVAATTLASVGGIFDSRIPGAEVALWTQIAGFFALDEILLALLWGLFRERPRRPFKAALPFWAAWLSAASMFAAALMGHLAGWILEFGDHPSIIANYTRWIGVKPADFTTNLIGSHSHEMAVASMGLISVLAVQQFGLPRLTGRARTASLAALGWLSFGVIAMTIAYLAMAFSSWAPPTLFQSAGGTNGIAGDDILTGLTVMLGGLIALVMTCYGRRHDMTSWLRMPLHLASATAWLASFATVVVAGYAIEMNETYFGGGGPAKGAAKDAVFTWLHQDIGLFLLPGLVLLAVATHRLITSARQPMVGWLIMAGTLVTLAGAMIFVFISPAIHGLGYLVSTTGLAVVAAGVVLAIYHMIINAPRVRARRAASAHQQKDLARS
jgi:hypothetical protein